MSKIIKCKTLDGNSLYIDIEKIDFIPIFNSSNNRYGMPYGRIYQGALSYDIDGITAHFIMAMKMNDQPVENVIDTSVISYDAENNTFTIGEPSEAIDDDTYHQMSIEDYEEYRPDGEDLAAEDVNLSPDSEQDS